MYKWEWKYCDTSKKNYHGKTETNFIIYAMFMSTLSLSSLIHFVLKDIILHVKSKVRLISKAVL